MTVIEQEDAPSARAQLDDIDDFTSSFTMIRYTIDFYVEYFIVVQIMFPNINTSFAVVFSPAYYCPRDTTCSGLHDR